MKRIRILLFSLMLIFAFSDKIFAVCEDEELNDWAVEATIQAIEDLDMDMYDENDKLIGTHKKEYHYLLLVYPQTNLVYAKVKDSLSNDEYRF